LASKHSKQFARLVLICDFVFGLILVFYVIVEWSIHPKFPAGQPLDAAVFWTCFAASLTTILNLILYSFVYRRILRRESDLHPKP